MSKTALQRFKYHGVALAILIVAIVSFIVLVGSKKAPDTVKDAENAVHVLAKAVRPQQYTPYLQLLGVVKSVHRSTLSIPVTAFVRKVRVQEGDIVNKGQILVEFDTTQIQHQIAAKSAEVQELDAKIATEKLLFRYEKKELESEKLLLKLKEREYSRQQKLLKQRASAQAGLDVARERVIEQSIIVEKLQYAVDNHEFRLQALLQKKQISVAKRQELLEDMARLQVKAPFTGIVTDRFISVGERISAGQRLLNLHDQTTLEVMANLPEHYSTLFFEALSNGQHLPATVENKQTDAKLSLVRISQKVHDGEVGQRVYFKVENRGRLVQNEHILLQVNLPKVKAVAIPAAALYRQNTVYAIEQDRLKPLQVTLLGQWRPNVAKNDLPTAKKRYLLVFSQALAQASQPVTLLMQHLPNARAGLKVKSN